MLKLICSDVDGTLVPDGGHELNPEYFSQIPRHQDQKLDKKRQRARGR